MSRARPADRSGSRVAFERDRGVTHLAARESVSHVSVCLPDPAAEMVAVFRRLAEADVNVYFVKIHEDCVCFAVDTAALDTSLSVLAEGGLDVRSERDCTIVSTVARSMRDMSGIMSRIMGCLNDAAIEVREFADSYNSVSCLVSASHAGRAISALSAEFGVALQAPSSEDPW